MIIQSVLATIPNFSMPSFHAQWDFFLETEHQFVQITFPTCDSVVKTLYVSVLSYLSVTHGQAWNIGWQIISRHFMVVSVITNVHSIQSGPLSTKLWKPQSLPLGPIILSTTSGGYFASPWELERMRTPEVEELDGCAQLYPGSQDFSGVTGTAACFSSKLGHMCVLGFSKLHREHGVYSWSRNSWILLDF